MMKLKAVPKNDRLNRWCILDMSASGKGKPVIADNIRTEKIAVLLASSLELQNLTLAMGERIEALEAALTEAHRVILHELDSGRTPYLLKAENGGKGFGYLEDTLSGITR